VGYGPAEASTQAQWRSWRFARAAALWQSGRCWARQRHRPRHLPLPGSGHGRPQDRRKIPAICGLVLVP